MTALPIDSADVLSRFLTQPRNHFVPTTGRVRYAAFLPSRALQTSVYQISGLADDSVWDLGDRFVAPLLATRMTARADIEAKIVFECGLAVDPDGVPHRRHANIVGWPESRSAQKLVAIKLAEAATCVFRAGC